MAQKMTGALVFDERTDRYDIRFDLNTYYGGLHCGECFDVFVRGKWKPTRIEYGDNLPKELDSKTHIAMVRQYAQEYFVQRGMCADISIHDKDDGNPHAHILLTTRPLDCAGRWMDKQHRNYLLDENGKRIFDPATGRYKLGRSIKTHDWDDSKRVQEWRAGWAETCNMR